MTLYYFLDLVWVAKPPELKVLSFDKSFGSDQTFALGWVASFLRLENTGEWGIMDESGWVEGCFGFSSFHSLN